MVYKKIALNNPKLFSPINKSPSLTNGLLKENNLIYSIHFVNFPLILLVFCCSMSLCKQKLKAAKFQTGFLEPISSNPYLSNKLVEVIILSSIVFFQKPELIRFEFNFILKLLQMNLC